MSSQTARSLGVLNLERGAKAGDSSAEEAIGTFRRCLDLPLIAETVAGAWADNVIRGDPSLESAYVAAAQRLVERGAVAITANCGYSIRHQAAVAAAVRVPVVVSSLVVLPSLLRQLPSSAKVAVIAADATCLQDDLLGIDDSLQRRRVIIGGIEGGTLWRNEMQRPPPPTDIADIQAEVSTCVARLLAEHPEIAALVFECTAFPLIAPAIRRETGLPVYDITTLCRLAFAAAA